MSPANVASRFFTMSEMRCHDIARTPYPPEYADRLVALFSQWDVIREAWGGPIAVISGYRTPAYNIHVGGAGQSEHVEGRAIDGRPLPCAKYPIITFSEIEKLHHLINQLVIDDKLPLVGGIGVYPLHRKLDRSVEVGWVHVDTRPKPSNGHIARWEGEKIGDEQAA